MTSYTEVLAELIEKSAAPEPTIADLVRLAIDALDIDVNEDAAAAVLNSILLHGDLAEAIYGRL